MTVQLDNPYDDFKILLTEKIDIGNQARNRLKAVSQRSEELFNFLKENNLLDREKINQNFYNKIDIFLRQKYPDQTSLRLNSSNDPLANISNLFLSTPQPKYLSELTTNLSYQVRKDVINHLENLIKNYFTKKESHSSQHYSNQDTTKHSPCDLQNQHCSESTTSNSQQEFSKNQQNPYPIFRDNQEFISLKSSFTRINNDIQRQIKQFQDIADKYENPYQYRPLQYNFEENKNNFKKILSLRRSLETKTYEALDKIISLVNYGFIDHETYYNSDKEIKDGLLKFKEDFQNTTYQIFKGLIQTYYYYSDADQYNKTRNQDTKLEILKNLYEINTNKSLFDEDIKNFCDEQFNYAIQDFVENNCKTNLYRLNIHNDSSEFNFNSFMKEKIEKFKFKIQSSPSTSLGSPYNSSRPVSPTPYRS